MSTQSQYDLWRARQGRHPVVRRFAHADFFRNRRGPMMILGTAPKAAPGPEGKIRRA
jgi:hypothetical protein